MCKCIQCGVETDGPILCPGCLERFDEPITKTQSSRLLSPGTLYMYCDRLEFQAKNPKKSLTIYYKEIENHGTSMKTWIDIDHSCGKSDSFDFNNQSLAEKWDHALSGLIEISDRPVFDQIEEVPTYTSEEEPPVTHVTEEQSTASNQENEEETSTAEPTGTAPRPNEQNRSSLLGGLSLRTLLGVAAVLIAVVVLFTGIFNGSHGGNAYYAELAAQEKMGTGFTVDEIDFKVVSGKKDTKYIVKCTAKSKEAKDMYEMVYGDTTVYFAYAEGYGSQYQYAIAASKREAKNKIDW